METYICRSRQLTPIFFILPNWKFLSSHSKLGTRYKEIEHIISSGNDSVKRPGSNLDRESSNLLKAFRAFSLALSQNAVNSRSTFSQLQWMQNNSELGLRYSEMRRWIGQVGARWQEDSLSMCAITENILSLFDFDTIGGHLIHRFLHYTVFCEPKEL
jgi:hypothetical protein